MAETYVRMLQDMHEGSLADEVCSRCNGQLPGAGGTPSRTGSDLYFVMERLKEEDRQQSPWTVMLGPGRRKPGKPGGDG